MVCKIPVKLFGQVFLTSLIILEGHGINVILGMSWMKMHHAVLVISICLVYLDSPILGKISLQLPPVARLQTSIHAVVAKSLDEISMVCEYPDVFSDDLPGMPLIGLLSSRSCCSLALQLSISDHIQWHRMSWQK
jgi:hypothetical protein